MRQRMLIGWRLPIPGGSRGLLQRTGGRVVAEAEEVADGGEDGGGVGVVGLGGGRADRGAGVVEELVLEAGGHVGDGLAVGGAQGGAGGGGGGPAPPAGVV